jgi:hypothetical protein
MVTRCLSYPSLHRDITPDIIPDIISDIIPDIITDIPLCHHPGRRPFSDYRNVCMVGCQHLL